MASSVQTLSPNVLSIVVGTTAAQVALGSQASPIVAWIIQNQGTATVYLGSSAVTNTAGAGIQITAGTSFNPDQHQKRDERQDYGLDNYWLVGPSTTTCVLFYHTIHGR